MCANDKAVQEYLERLRSLLLDGYTVVHDTKQGNFEFVRLRHRNNGKSVFLSRRDNVVQQRSGTRLVFSIAYE